MIFVHYTVLLRVRRTTQLLTVIHITLFTSNILHILYVDSLFFAFSDWTGPRV